MGLPCPYLSQYSHMIHLKTTLITILIAKWLWSEVKLLHPIIMVALIVSKVDSSLLGSIARKQMAEKLTIPKIPQYGLLFNIHMQPKESFLYQTCHDLNWSGIPERALSRSWQFRLVWKNKQIMTWHNHHRKFIIYFWTTIEKHQQFRTRMCFPLFIATNTKRMLLNYATFIYLSK